MRCDGQELHVSESGFAHVFGELVGEFDIGQVRTPGAEMHFIDAERLLVLIGGRAVSKPSVIIPRVMGLGDHRGIRRGDLGSLRHGIGLEVPGVVGTQNLELVSRARCDAGDEEFPDSGGAEGAHGCAAAIPEVEVTDHSHTLSSRSPHRERDTRYRAVCSIECSHVRTEGIPELLVASFAD